MKCAPRDVSTNRPSNSMSLLRQGSANKCRWKRRIRIIYDFKVVGGVHFIEIISDKIVSPPLCLLSICS